MILKRFIDDLVQRTDIVDVIGKSVQLKKAGNEFKGLCPFHHEKTPSFSVNPSKQFYHCFGCGESGDVIRFLEKHAGKSFRDAVAELASAAGVDVPDGNGGNNDRRKAETAADNHALVSHISDWYREQLLGDTPHIEARRYLKDRCIDRETAETFGLGFAPAGWDNVLKKFGSTASLRRQLEDVGFIVRKDKEEGHFYDRFRNRVMFPITDSRDRIVGFGARAIDDQQPKYLNTPTTAIFRKKCELFGVTQAKPEINRTGTVLVVEGYTDVLALHQTGVTNAVATCGTAMTAENARRLFRLAEEVVFCFDGDAAGRQAAMKALWVMLPEMTDGKFASLIFLPDGEDPDSLVRKDPDWFHNRLKADLQSGLDYLLGKLRDGSGRDRLDGTARYFLRIAEVVGLLPADGALRKIVANFCLKETGACPLSYVQEPAVRRRRKQ